MLTANFYSVYAKAKESQPDCLPQRTPCQDRKDSSSSWFPKVTVRAVSFISTFGIPASRAADYHQQHSNVQLRSSQKSNQVLNKEEKPQCEHCCVSPSTGATISLCQGWSSRQQRGRVSSNHQPRHTTPVFLYSTTENKIQ